jgi:hypothetical protein
MDADGVECCYSENNVSYYESYCGRYTVIARSEGGVSWGGVGGGRRRIAWRGWWVGGL